MLKSDRPGTVARAFRFPDHSYTPIAPRTDPPMPHTRRAMLTGMVMWMTMPTLTNAIRRPGSRARVA